MSVETFLQTFYDDFVISSIIYLIFFSLYKLQHGSRAKRSTETQLLTFVQDLYKNLRNNKKTNVTVMDFAKAFDKVPHKKLIRKLREYGIHNSINQWIESFLHQRQQRVVCEGEMSSSCD